MNKSQLIAHRGYMQRYPENTWAGLKAAIETGANWLEFDIQMCADGQFVLMHDASFQRTAHVAQSVFEFELKQTANISVHEPSRFADQFAPLPPSSLIDIITALEDHPSVRCMIEIKEESLGHWGLHKVMDQFLTQMSPFGTRHVVISFSHEALSYAKQMSNKEIGWVMRDFSPEQLRLAETLAPDYLICNHEKIGSPRHLPRGNWKWMLYDITDPRSAQAWFDHGVELIETCDIGVLLRSLSFD